MLEALLYVAPAAGAEYYDDAIDVADVIADDMMQPGTNVDWLLPDQGDLETFVESYENLYNNLAEASWNARDATRRIKELVPNPESHVAIARGYFWDGILRVTLADLFDPITFDGGPPLSPIKVYQDAITILNDAVQVAQAANQTTLRAGALATIARVHRSLYFEQNDASRLATAAQFATQALAVQSNFRVDAVYNPPGSTNVLSGFSANFGSLTNRGVGLLYVNRLDPVSGVLDPRVRVSTLRGTGVHGPYYFQLKYPERNSPVAVSRWQEARLIIAEYRLATGDLAGAVQEINLVRQAAGLGVFASTDAAQIRQQLIYERRTEFWLELRGWQDHRYYGVFPDNWTDAARQKGLNRRLPISRRERDSNPNLQGS
ncbi:MAG TPA: RagB/SusD family nutrient uptake outer membrane protein [Gemmatimonadaceae bacterium]|nr:RagB/SusD family nutrient uptake outer membrane protein [Gemmatimonadaceae bacterium]